MEWLQIGRDSEEILTLEPRRLLADEETVAVIGHTKCLAKPTNRTPGNGPTRRRLRAPFISVGDGVPCLRV